MREGRWLLLLLLAGVVSCSSDRKPVHPVRGKVFYRGKPAAGAQVIFHLQGAAAVKVPRPTARVEKDGTFRLSTYLSHDGAPAGRYAVTIVWPSPAHKVDTEDVGPDQLHGKYSDPRTTPLHSEVADGVNELEPIFLK